MKAEKVEKRCFLCIGGYEPIDAHWWHQRFVRESKRFETTWNVTADVSPPVLREGSPVASWKMDTKGANWRVEAEYRLLAWDDIVSADFSRSNFVRWPKGIAALLDFVFSGAILRYFHTSVRYGFFFLYPFVILGGILAAAIFAPRLLALAGLPLPGLASPVLCVAVLIGLLYLAGRVLLLNYMFDDWIFAGQFIYRTRPELDARLDHFAQEIVAASRDTSFDEVIVSAHSLGGALIMDALGRALKLDPELGRHGPELWLMATGSSLLKEALHPKAAWLREAVDRIASAPGVSWIEYQASADVISFYRVDPVAAMGLPPRNKPIVQKVRMREMLSRAAYKRFRLNFFRLHRQWGMGNEVRYFYDYYQIICGPAPLARRAIERERFVSAFSADGGYDPAAPVLAAKVANS